MHAISQEMNRLDQKQKEDNNADARHSTQYPFRQKQQASTGFIIKVTNADGNNRVIEKKIQASFAGTSRA